MHQPHMTPRLRQILRFSRRLAGIVLLYLVAFAITHSILAPTSSIEWFGVAAMSLALASAFAGALMLLLVLWEASA